MSVIIYHRDNDGCCAGAIAFRKLSGATPKSSLDRSIERDIKCISMNYNEPFPFDKIRKNEIVIIVDFSLNSTEDWERLFEITTKVTWIDHHKTVLEAGKHDIASKLSGIRSISKSACELTWEYFYPNEEATRIVKCVGDYDMWAFKCSETWDLYYGLMSENIKPESPFWDIHLVNYYGTEFFNLLLEKGRVIEVSEKARCRTLIEATGFYADFEGHRCICVNSPLTGARVFDSVDKKTFDIMSIYYHDGSMFVISIYSDSVDVSKIANIYNGGGHKNAAGFVSIHLPFYNIRRIYGTDK